MPQLGNNYDGWAKASLTVDADGNVRDIKVSAHSEADKALLKALNGMGKWICLHHKGQRESVKISFAYLKGKPYYMLSERIITSADGSKLKVEDEFDLSGDFAYALWSGHEETDM